MRFLFLFCAVCIFVVGLVMIFSTTSGEVLDHDLTQSTHKALFKQLAFACVGLLCGLGVWKLGYRQLLCLSPFLLGLFTILLILTLIPGVGHAVNGSRRWLNIGGISFQPSEFVKYIVPFYFIHRFLQYEEGQFNFKAFLKLVGTVGVPIFLVMIEPNNGTAGVIGVTVLVCLLLTRVKFTYWALPLLSCMLLGGVFASQLPYVQGRLKVYLNPELDLRGKGHQPYQAKIAAGSGKMFGKGPGNSWQKLSYLPEAQNDYIAAIYAEEFGFVGVLTLILLYMLLAYIGAYLANQAPDQAGFFLASCVVFLICFQAFMNLGVVSGLLPSTGLNLPLFSQGGTSLIANIVGISLVLRIATYSAKSAAV